MAAISSGQVSACWLLLRTRAAASRALSLAGLAAGMAGAAWPRPLAPAGAGAAVFPGRAALAVCWRVRGSGVFFLAAMMLLLGQDGEPGSAPAALPHPGQHSYLVVGTGSRPFRRDFLPFSAGSAYPPTS